MVDFRDLTYTYFCRHRQPRWLPPLAWKTSSIMEIGAGISPVACNATSGFYLALDLAHPRKKMPFAYVQSDARQVALQDKSFDYFISISMLEHVAEPLEILSELNRVSKCGGIISVPALDNFSFIYDPINWLRLRLGQPVINYGIGGFGHLCVLSNQGWRELFAKAGFKVVDVSRAKAMDLFETLEFSLLSLFFSRYEYNELLKKLGSVKQSVKQSPGFFTKAITAFYPVLKRIWAGLFRLQIPSPGSVSSIFTLECQR